VSVRAAVAHGAHDLRVEEVDEQPLGRGEVEVRPLIGGICGSDLHYFNDGAVGDFALREPMVLGHELVAEVVRAEAADAPAPGTLVAIDPSRPCRRCERCRAGAPNLCTEVRFLGSAARFPHVQGGFRERLVVGREQVVPLPDGLEPETAAFAEPLAVAIHAVGRAGALLGKDVLVTGAGPIGLLVVLAAARAGAASITVSDLHPTPLARAREVGATATVDAREPVAAGLADVAFEASGSPAALESCVRALRPGGRIVAIGMGGGKLPSVGGPLVAREIELVGSFRFTAAEFRTSVRELAAGIGVRPLLSGSFALDDALEAFETASRPDATKVQLAF
jgi:L-idonate 5-dehydrogenase